MRIQKGLSDGQLGVVVVRNGYEEEWKRGEKHRGRNRLTAASAPEESQRALTLPCLYHIQVL